MTGVMVKLQGGLGNQMFQYAAGRSLSIKLNIPLILDASWYINEPNRPFLLCHYSIPSNINIKKRTRHYGLFFLLEKIIGYREGLPLLKEKQLSFNKNFKDVCGPVFLDGYWQSEQYFSIYQDTIKREFRLIAPFEDRHNDVRSSIENSNSVCIHFRRGDYIQNPIANNFHGICSVDYYMKSVELISNKINSPRFFIFSDDLHWVKKNIKFNHPTTYVDVNNINEPYFDMALMSCCKHFIIANSTFSWWAAWLCNNDEKIIISPKKWFKNESNNNDDLIPNTWIKI